MTFQTKIFLNSMVSVQTVSIGLTNYTLKFVLKKQPEKNQD